MTKTLHEAKAMARLAALTPPEPKPAPEPPKKEATTMSREADKVSNVLSGVEALEKRAEEVGQKITGAFDELHEAFTMAEVYGDAVSNAARKIKGFLAR